MRYLRTFESMDKAKSIISKKMEAFDKLKSLLKGNLGYIGKFTEFLMEENVPYKELEKLYNDIIRIKGNNRSIDISNLSYEEVLDEIIKTDDDLFVKSVINQFPSTQRKFIDEEIFNRGIGIIKGLKGKDIKALVSKISRFKSKSELVSAIKIFSKDSKNDRESVVEYIEKSKKSSIVFSSDDVLVVKVGDIEDIKVLGSDTSWCILNQHSWNHYTKEAYQFILFDFMKDTLDKEFKIGFTIKTDGTIKAAHDMLDNNLLDEIHSILSKNKIEVSKLTIFTEKEKIDISNLKLNKNTSINNLKLIISNTSIDERMNLIKKLIGLEITNTSKISLIQNLILRHYSNKEYVTEDELVKDGGKLLGKFCDDMSRITTKFIFPDRINWRISNEVLSKTFNMYSDKSFEDIHPNNIFNYRNREPIFNSDNLLLINNRLSNLDVGYRKTDRGGYSGVYECLVLLDRILGFNKIPIDKINKMSKYFKLEYARVLKIPLDEISVESPKTFEFLVKKDYDDIRLSMYNFNNVGDLLVTLKGCKLGFTIDRVLFNTIKGYNKKQLGLPYMKYSDESERLKLQLKDLIKTFVKSPKNGSSVTDGEWTVVFKL